MFIADTSQDADVYVNGTVQGYLISNAIPSQNLPTLQTNRGFTTDSDGKIVINSYSTNNDSNSSSSTEQDGYQLQFDHDIGEDERRFYLKLFPLVNLVREKKTHCTSCNTHLGTAPANEQNVKMHPILRVSQCKKCHDFYNSGEFSKGEDGSELYCRWCGQGGEVYCCAKCPYVFCKACIGGNLAKSLVADIRDNENWSCFVCSPKITWPIRAVHWALKNYIEKQKQSILLTNSNDAEIRRLMKKDTSICCRGKTANDDDSSNDSDAPLSVKRNSYGSPAAAAAAKKRKQSLSEEILGQPKPKVLNTSMAIGSVSSNASAAASLHKNPAVTLTPKTLMLNSGLVIQKQPTQTAATTLIRPSIPNQTQVKIVQLTNQQNKNINVALNMPSHSTTTSGGGGGTAPPPLLIRNRGVQIRQHPIANNNSNQMRTVPSIHRTTSVASTSSSSNNEHTPVYHTIGGFCIDLNSAAQHDSIRLPNGKLIQVKKSSNNASTGNQRNQIPSGILNTQPTQPQQHFTITQPFQQQQQQPQQQNIQTIPASAIIPNATGSLQILNGNVISQIQQHQQNAQQQSRSNGPTLIKNIFQNTPVGRARNQLQNQIFTAMEICQHLSGKIQTLTNSNPYKNANSHIDVKELYIHLSYLFTYAIGRFKNLQDKCNDDMTSMGFNTDVSKLTKGQLAAEKYASDGDEDEIEIVEPKTTTIDLDSDDDDNGTNSQKRSETGAKVPNNMGIHHPPLIAVRQIKDLQRQQQVKQNQMLRDKQNQQQAYKMQEMQRQQQQQMHMSDENDYDLPISLLAGMLEVELTEGNDSINSTSSLSSAGGQMLPKKPRKKTTNKPNPHLVKQKQAQIRAKYIEIKKNDLKLKQECSVAISSMDLGSEEIQKTFERFYEHQQQYNEDDNKDDDYMDASGNLEDDGMVEVMQLLEVTMERDEDSAKNIETARNDVVGASEKDDGSENVQNVDDNEKNKNVESVNEKIDKSQEIEVKNNENPDSNEDISERSDDNKINQEDSETCGKDMGNVQEATHKEKQNIENLAEVDENNSKNHLENNKTDLEDNNECDDENVDGNKVVSKLENKTINNENDIEIQQKKSTGDSEIETENSNEDTEIETKKLNSDSEQESSDKVSEIKNSIEDVEIKTKNSIEDADIETKNSIEDADIETKDSIEGADIETKDSIEDADIETKGSIEDAEIENKDSIGDADIETKDSIEDAEIETKGSIEDAEIETKNSIEDADIETKNSIEDADIETKDSIEDNEIETKTSIENADIETEKLIENSDIEMKELNESPEAKKSNEESSDIDMSSSHILTGEINKEIIDKIAEEISEDNNLLDKDSLNLQETTVPIINNGDELMEINDSLLQNPSELIDELLGDAILLMNN